MSKSIQTLSSQNAYAKWASNYPPSPHNPLMTVEQKAVLEQLPNVRQKTVLDLACGSGRYASILMKRGASSIIGIDNSEPMLRRGIADNIAINWIQGDLQQLPLRPQSIDIIICGLAIGHLIDPDPAFAEMYRTLKQNGTAIISDFHPVLFHSGGKRTFQSETGKTYAVEHYPHMPEFISTLADHHGFHLNAIVEPTMIIDAKSQPAVIIYCLSVKERRFK